MNKTNFLRTLRGELAPLTSQEQEQIIDEYVSIFEIKQEEGLSDEQIIEELGDPRKIGAQFLAEFKYESDRYYDDSSKVYQNGQVQQTNRRFGLFVAMIVFHVLLGFWLFFTAWMLVLSIYLAAIACLLASLAAIMWINPSLMGAISYVLLAIGLGLLMLACANILARWAYKITITHLKWLKSLL